MSFNLPTFSDNIKLKALITDMKNNMDIQIEIANLQAKLKKIKYDAFVKEGFSESQAIILCKDDLFMKKGIYEKRIQFKRILEIHNIEKIEEIRKDQFSLYLNGKEVVMYWMKQDNWYVIGANKNGTGISSMIEEYNTIRFLEK